MKDRVIIFVIFGGSGIVVFVALSTLGWDYVAAIAENFGITELPSIRKVLYACILAALGLIGFAGSSLLWSR